MVKNKMVYRLVSLLCSLFLLASSVLVPCVSSYASVAPAVDVGEGLTYLFQMLSSSLGSAVTKASVPSLYLAVDAYSKTSDPAYMAQLREYYEDDALVRSEPIDTGFCNWLLGAIKDVFVSSGDYGTDVMQYTVPVYGGATYFDVETRFSFTYTNGVVYSYDVVAPSGVYLVPICGDKAHNVHTSSPDEGICVYLVSGSPFSATVNSSVRDASYIKFLGSNAYCVKIHVSSMNPSAVDKVFDFPYPWISVGYNPIASDTYDVSIILDKALEIIQAQALVKTPSITAPISVPADVSAMEKNAKAVAAANDADALYKALSAAGIAIGVDVDVPDETDKPTDAEIPDEGTSTIGKSLSDILAAITGMADKVGAIPAQIESFFTIDTDAIGDAFMGLKDAFSSRFDALLKITNMFTNLSPKLDSAIPLISIRVPPSLQPIYNAEEVVVFDLRGYESTCSLIRLFFRALLWFGFGYVVLREFDVKFHVS